jgi:putative iron-regulated protein
LRHEHGGIEANVATGFHAIEFLLWGQDLNTDETAAGQRPFTDYLAGSACTNPPCDRRGRYLREVAGLLVADLREMTVDWEAEVGEYRRYFDGLPNGEKIRRMLVGLGSMAGGELAGERLRVPLLAAAQEDEHSCFSDTTHFDIYYNVVGIRNLYLGTYKSAAGEMLVGPAPADWVRNIDPGLHERLMAELASAEARAEAIVERAGSGLPFDRQILGTDPESLGTLAALIDHLEQAAAVFDEALGAL